MMKRWQIIAQKIGTNFLLVIFICFPFVMKGQIESSKMLFVLNNSWHDDIFFSNELSYYSLNCVSTSQLPRAKKGKYFCQNEYYMTRIGTTPVYKCVKKYYNDQKRLECIVLFTLDSLSRDTIEKSRIVFCYGNDLLMFIVSQRLIDKNTQNGIHVEKSKKILSPDTTRIHYDYISSNVKKGYYYSYDNDTSWFHYLWKKTDGSSFQLTSYFKNGEVEMMTKVNKNDFYQFFYGIRKNADFRFGSFFSKDSILTQSYLPSSTGLFGFNAGPFHKGRIVYRDTIMNETIEMYSNIGMHQNQDIKISREVKLNSARMPIWIREVGSSSDGIKTKTLYYIYSYEARIE